MPKELKEAIAERFKARAAELGMPDLYDKLADETAATDAETLLAWLTEKEHPALTMPSLI
jgi:acetyl-CoA synthase